MEIDTGISWRTVVHFKHLCATERIREVHITGGQQTAVCLKISTLSADRRRIAEGIIQVIEAHVSRMRNEEEHPYKLKLQKKGLMHDLLTGKLRVRG